MNELMDTVNSLTYRYHIAKLRWFCEHVHGVPPSRWSVQDVEAFYGFLTEVPDWALCARDEMSGAYAGRCDGSILGHSSTGGAPNTSARRSNRPAPRSLTALRSLDRVQASSM